MKGWPVPEREGDAPPTREELAEPGVTSVARRVLRVGPLSVGLATTDDVALRAVASWPVADAAASPSADIELRCALVERRPFLGVRPGERARVTTWRDGDAFHAMTHEAALRLEPSGRGVALACSSHDAGLALAVQNVIRIAVAWRLASTARGLLVHASAVERDGEALVFLGPSGSGKSTVARLSRPRPILADDVVILAPHDGAPSAWSTPLWAEPGMGSDATSAGPRRVGALLRLRQAPRHDVEPLTSAAAAAAIVAHAPFIQDIDPNDASALAGALARGVSAATLAFAKDAGFWPLLAPDSARAPIPSTGSMT